jgi:hypothetical protein
MVLLYVRPGEIARKAPGKKKAKKQEARDNPGRSLMVSFWNVPGKKG